jgi:diaminohydroxyphosphoribosylaminopyrimidine deaminase/5-amino-6-(5-phosphoribosylamino)uracil reductase
MSLDGYLTRPPGETRWLTSESSRTHAHQLRALVDAIIVGAETIRRDNPRLTVRKGPRRTQPWRVILTKSGRLPGTLRFFEIRRKSARWFIGTSHCERSYAISGA